MIVNNFQELPLYSDVRLLVANYCYVVILTLRGRTLQALEMDPPFWSFSALIAPLGAFNG